MARGKNWMYLILLETIDDLLKELLPAAVPQEGVEMDEEITVYDVVGERIHVGEAVAYGPLQLLVGPGEKYLQSHIAGTPGTWDRHDARSRPGRLCPTHESR